jgi:glycine/serine hydroxymethyltransferase
MQALAGFMERVVAAPGDDTVIERVAAEVKECCARFPAPGILL